MYVHTEVTYTEVTYSKVNYSKTHDCDKHRLELGLGSGCCGKCGTGRQSSCPETLSQVFQVAKRARGVVLMILYETHTNVNTKT
jgi:hypothetical protein